MGAPPTYDTEAKRLRYVVEQLKDQGISESDISRAAGFARTEVKTILKRLEAGERTSTEKWRALYFLLQPSPNWWFLGEGESMWAPDSCTGRIRELSSAAKDRELAAKIERSEAEGEPESTDNVVRLPHKKQKS